MRVALLTYSTKPRGGVVHTLALAEALARQGCDVDVWTLARGGDRTFFRSVDPAVGVHAVPFPEVPAEGVGARIVRSIDTLAAALADVSYDVVHAQDCISANAVLAAGLPCLRTIHHLDTFTTPELVACHDRAVVEPSGHVCVSETVAMEVAAQFGVRPVVIPNGVDAARFARAAGPDAAASRGRWQEELGPYVLALGGIEPRKGSIDLLEAFALIRRRRPEMRLVFAGGETLFDYRDYRAAFDRRASELHLQPALLGVVDDDELPSLVAAASAMAFVSTKEGFGLAAMEALAAGVPVVARDLPVLREVFGDAVVFASDLMSIAGSLADVLENPPDPETGRVLARSSSWEAAASAHLDLYARHAGRA
ncbi:MSMEG_0565 family glycosyltransferase [Aeromicrobium sp. Leaf245]|uniref:MSMEG_0565 family glycosyltransferase n=1 Tax=Aeromicrobium sp. Leaf245 TaxID=1736306 RepID=UPI0006F38835|nr:MSMEG_0565 family glycosyltransferase [Aeromicrobium sp. Leaf245]KQO39160.1 glycosyl transferase family 1 [Aeromicrobium sp. Leaf245]